MMRLFQNTFVAIMLLSVFSHSFATPDTTSPDVSHPAPSPDGDKVIFVSNAGMAKTYDIWIAERDGKSPRVLLAWGDSDEKYPDWSHDAKKIVFCSLKSGTSHLWEIDVITGGVTQLTNGPGNNCQPRYSPDGQTILFVSDRSGKRELWMMNSDGTEQKAIALIPLKVSDPAWSPDGERVVFVGCRDSQCNLYSIAVNGGDAKQITFGPFNDWNPDWGKQGIVFASDRDQVQGLWIVKPNGTGLALLPDLELRGDMYPRWDDSKDTIIFARYAGDSRGNLPQVFEFVWAEASVQLTDVTGESTISVDARPGSCPNPLNLRSRGVMPVAILGTPEFDVRTIDPATVKLGVEGANLALSPLRWAIEDVSTPYEGGFSDPKDAKNCIGGFPDGYDDLSLKFETQALASQVAALGYTRGDVVVLSISGNKLEKFGGAAFKGKDVLLIVD